MRIAFFEVKDWEEEHLKNWLSKHLLKFYNEKLSLDNAQQVKDSDAISVFIYSNIDERIISGISQFEINDH